MIGIATAPLLQVVLLALPALAALWFVRRRAESGPLRSGVVLLAAGSAMAFALARPEPTPPLPGVPLPQGAPGYVSSNACRSCHPAQFATWHQSYHRSMTELARPETVRAPWDDIALEWRGGRYRLYRRGEQFWALLPDPGSNPPAEGDTDLRPLVERQVVMTTGSHHYQAYWVQGARGNELLQMPFVYHFATRRFLPRQDVFLQPPDAPAHAARWNSNCIQCHSVGGQPRHELANDRFATQVVELGIACEACHGSGAEHVAKQQNPLARHAARGDDAPDPSIVNPARLGAERASEVCGQCHSYFVPNDADLWWQSGFAGSYRPGQALEPTRHVLDYDLDTGNERIDTELGNLFYTDGTMRVGGREWNGLKRSACFEDGQGERQLSCESCHRLHGGSRDDQLDLERDVNQACGGCHSEEAAAPASHSHHAAGTSGNECVNCHMPFTSYALFKGIRSHRITRPLVDTERGAAPNACNLCHLDQGLRWTSEWIARWYGEPDVYADAPEAAGALAVAGDLLSGDAAVRVILANQMGWAPAQVVAGRALLGPLLVEALDDPYAAVRFVAARSLASLPGFAGWQYDFIAERGARVQAQQAARQRLGPALAAQRRPRQAPLGFPLDSSGALERTTIEGLIAKRDPRPIQIAE